MTPPSQQFFQVKCDFQKKLIIYNPAEDCVITLRISNIQRMLAASVLGVTLLLDLVPWVSLDLEKSFHFFDKSKILIKRKWKLTMFEIWLDVNFLFITPRVRRFVNIWGQTVISTSEKTKKTKGQENENKGPLWPSLDKFTNPD